MKPEKGTAKVIGAIWESQSITGLHASVNLWKIDERDRVVLPSGPQAIIDNEAQLPSLVTRGPSGAITDVAWTYINFGTYIVQGVDYDISYTFDTSVGRWIAGASASQTTKYDTSIVPGSPAVSRLNHPDSEGWAPRLKGRLQLGWQKGAWSLGVTGRYVSRYFDYGSDTRSLGDEWYTDLSATVALGQFMGWSAKPLKQSKVSLGVVNATNRLPRWASTPAGFDTFQADIRGRYVAVQVSLPWQ